MRDTPQKLMVKNYHGNVFSLVFDSGNDKIIIIMSPFVSINIILSLLDLIYQILVLTQLESDQTKLKSSKKVFSTVPILEKTVQFHSVFPKSIKFMGKSVVFLILNYFVGSISDPRTGTHRASTVYVAQPRVHPLRVHPFKSAHFEISLVHNLTEHTDRVQYKYFKSNIKF